MARGINKCKIWQISAGPADQHFASLFLKHGVALIGPGDAGPWNADCSDDDFEGGYVRHFASQLHVNDVILLRTGRSTLQAVGLIVSKYLYLSQFDDVHGRDLQHVRRVRWCPLPEPYDFESTIFGASPPRLSRIQSTDAVNYAMQFVQSPPTDWQTRALPSLPVEEPTLHTPPGEVRELVAQVDDLLTLYWDANAFGERPTEDELVGHYVLPLLRMLGWPPERIAVKWRNIDVVLFSRLPRIPDHCQYIVEAKRLGANVEGALDQAMGYVSDLGVKCDIVVTDGIRYRMYDANKGFVPDAYANLSRLKQSSLDLFNRMRR